MLFNSNPFILFFVVVFFAYWFPLKKNTKAQNVFLLLASYFFYGYAEWRMLPLLVVATAVFFFLGRWIGRTESEKCASWLTALGVMLGVGLLLYFKYFDFFIVSFSRLFDRMGLHTNWHTFNIIMPVGISFFTFKLISYVVEIHRGKIEPTESIVDFATYIAFFPCILSGPIDRPQFIGQLQKKREFTYGDGADALQQILWGMFKKMVIADKCAIFVDSVWKDIAGQSGSTLALSAVLYAFQMYADFSGYSDMAIGVGKLLGFRITRNFNYPFFAVNMADFWRRWHISLTSWLTDYVFTPLYIRFRNLGKAGIIFAIIINMVVIGLWHGANWLYAVFGLYHGLLFIPLILSDAFMKKAKLETNRLGLPVLKDFGRILLTFLLVTLGLIIFKAESIGLVWDYYRGMIQFETLRASYLFFTMPEIRRTVMFIVLMLTVEWLQREKEHGLKMGSEKRYFWPRLAAYYVVVMMIVLFGQFGENSFIYFQF